ncbi:unnamed protein product [Adineta ricciae]|uniref:Protein-glucosylgalactosylhydroxylysine glucosidase n=1 Tax=Adineta ricciae TaxID=249248 RepID=A0A816B7Z8_ADIRI|nr:unnamed protein product [Adineta ricciae]
MDHRTPLININKETTAIRRLFSRNRIKISTGIISVAIVIVCATAILTPMFISKHKNTTPPLPASINLSDSTTVFSTNKLPMSGSTIDYRLMPYVGNGHVATVIFSDFIYMNGIFNGENGTSHRARIPSTLNWQFRINSSSSLYSLDVASGAFTEELEDNQVRVERRIFASQEYTELLITYVIVTRLGSTGNPIIVPVEVNEQTTSVDFNLTVMSRDDKCVFLAGKTHQVENNRFQRDVLPLFVYYTPLPANGLQLGAHETNHTYIFVTSLDTQQDRAKRSFDYASTERQPDQLWSAHVSRWNNIWSNGSIEIRGDDELQRQIYGAFYYILSSLPPLSSLSEHKQFYGLSPGTLSWGGMNGESYSGHSFWDMETWMYPPVLLFYPTLAKEMLSYRIAMNNSAASNADLFGYEGWRFPWESAHTGVDVTPDCCPTGRLYEMHITGDIAFAARQYIAATKDQKWLISEMGGDLIYETAHFWASRAIYNPNRKQFEILMVLPPDEDAQPFKNNSAYTNAIASLSIELANQVSCITKKPVPQAWLNVSRNLYIPFDNVSQIHLEYENFDPKHTIIKQADVVLLGFPLMWPMSEQIRRNDLLTYAPLTRDDGPAMTWSMHGIGYIELNDFDSAEKYFRHSYEIYVRKPFNVWTETQQGVGAVNFITGAGGFLQAVLFGYGGIRLTLNELVIMPPKSLPNQSTNLIFHGLKYQGATLDLTMDSQMYQLYVRALDNASQPLVYEHDQQHGILHATDLLHFPVATRLSIHPATPICP